MTIRKILKIYSEKTIIISFTLILCLFVLEIGLRALGRQPSNMTDGFYEQYKNSYRLKKNVKKVTKWPAHSYTTFTNSFGFRDLTTGIKNLDKKSYFAFLGDSQTFGNGVDYQDSFVGIFAGLISEKGIEVLNLGVGGHHFNDQESLFMDFCKNVSRKPVKVFLCLDPVSIHSFDKEYKHIIVKSGYLFDSRRGWKIPYVKMVISNVSAAYCFFRDNLRKLETKWFHKEFAGDVPPYLKIFSRNNRMHHPDTVKKFESYLNRFEEYCHRIGTTPIYVYLGLADSFRLNELLMQLGKDPKDYDTSFYEKYMINYCNNRKVKLINTKPALRKFHDKGMRLSFKIDPHYNEFANRVVGEYLNSKVFCVEKLQ